MTSDKETILGALIDENVFVRAVTFHYTGRLVAYDGVTLHLDDAAWVASSGPFAAALATGHLHEVEPFPDGVYVAAAAVVDVSIWQHDLPRRRQ